MEDCQVFVFMVFPDLPDIGIDKTHVQATPNKLAGCDDYKWLASQSIELLLNEEKREACIAGLKDITSLIGTPGASAKAADEALSMI
ncbi:MAG: hypothetical protein GY777_03225 [Candidatus Brocadiaceae bacterium]|nr:hypothetical protein [Candidatus Brocadiaceae bacterium]